MADLYVRSYNPIWDFRSLTGLPLDDNSYAYFLTNTIPYIPQAVYHTGSGTEWNDPVQLSAAGTLQNIFFDPALVYRIEIRTNDGIAPPSQADALVWLIENYVPNDGGNTPPVTSGNLASNNQITNPQFSLLNFNSPLTLSGAAGQTIEITPGWDLVLTGNGDVTLTQLDLTSTTSMPTNAPYALRLQLTSWTTAYLRQRFNQNGILWANKNVTASVTARIEGTPQTITATLVDSQSAAIGTVITATLNSNYEEYTGNLAVGESTNTNTPPNAYIELRINLPGSSDISLTSVQVLSTNNAVQLTYEQETIERQVDHTFHVYKDSMLRQQKESILTGWDFPLNPWQFTTTVLTNLAGTDGYTADQTIVVTEETDSVQVGRSANPLGYFQIASRVPVAQGRIAIVQYIDPSQASSVWNSVLSAMVQMKLTTSVASVAKIKMRLIYSSTLPTTVSPISSWGATNPVFTGQWTAVAPLNDPEYTLSSTVTDFNFEQFTLPAMTGTTATLGVVLYTTTDLSSASADSLLIKAVSLVQNDFSLIPNTLTFDETLRRCQFYYEKSYETNVLPAAISALGQYQTVAILSAGGIGMRSYRAPINLVYKTIKRIAPTVSFYSPVTGTVAKVRQEIVETTAAESSDDDITNYTQTAISTSAVYYMSNSAAQTNETGIVEKIQAITLFQYVLDARLGI